MPLLPRKVLIALICLAPLFIVTQPAHASDRNDPQVLSFDRALQMINQVRRQHGLGPVTYDRKLLRAARNHSADMAKAKRLSHASRNGNALSDRLKRVAYQPQLAAENIAMGQPTFPEALQSWYHSPSHRASLLDPELKQIGIAVIVNDKAQYRTFWTLVLATPKPSIRLARNGA